MYSLLLLSPSIHIAKGQGLLLQQYTYIELALRSSKRVPAWRPHCACAAEHRPWELLRRAQAGDIVNPLLGYQAREIVEFPKMAKVGRFAIHQMNIALVIKRRFLMLF